jgi:hypothetical protein
MLETIGNPDQCGAPAFAGQLGRVHSVSGSQAIVGIVQAALSGLNRDSITVGKFAKIQTRTALIVGMITDVTAHTSIVTKEQDTVAVARVDLMGEIARDNSNTIHFYRGVSDYPTIGDPVTAITHHELSVVLRKPGIARSKSGSFIRTRPSAPASTSMRC